MCEKLANGEWSAALNLGPQINTEYEEESPFILPDNVTLYFSSKGHESMVVLIFLLPLFRMKDIGRTPENVGYPINTTDDDVFMCQLLMNNMRIMPLPKKEVMVILIYTG